MFVKDGNKSPEFPQPRTKARGPSEERGLRLIETHDGTGGLHAIEHEQLSTKDVIEGWPRADQL